MCRNRWPDVIGMGGRMFRNAHAKGWFGINNPIAATCRSQHPGKSLLVGQSFNLAEELQLPGLEGSVQRFQKQPSEQARQHPDRQKEIGTAGNPAAAVRRWPPARYDAMEMGMVAEGLAPAVQNSEETDPGAEMSGVGSDDAQGLGRCPEQDTVDNLFVLEGKRPRERLARSQRRW